MIDNQPDDMPGSAQGNALGGMEVPPVSVGVALREARAGLGFSVTDVANRLKFAPRQIEALEADDFAQLPEMTFVRGFVRSYAKLLQLDPVPLLAALPEAAVQPAPQIATTLAEIPFPDIYAARKPNIIWLAAALAVAIALALFAWLHGSAPSAPKAPHVETPAIPASAPVAEVARAPQFAEPEAQQAAIPPAKPVAEIAVAKHATIRLVFDEESWVEVTDGDGKVLLSQVGSPGSERSVIKGKSPFFVVIGHASGVHLYYKGKAVDLTPHTKAEVARLTLE